MLLPMPEATTRAAALLSGQVDIVEAPSPDMIPRLKSAGMNVITHPYPHIWPYLLNFTRGPFQDLRVRQAANYAINRDEVVELLEGVAIIELRHLHAVAAKPRAPVRIQMERGQSDGPAQGSQLLSV